MTSKRNLERRLESLGGTPDFDGPDEIVITDHVVSTSWSAPDDIDIEPSPPLRVWRDDRGEWHSEEVTDGVETQS